MRSAAYSSSLNLLLLFLLVCLSIVQASKACRHGRYNKREVADDIPELVNRVENLMRDEEQGKRRQRHKNLHDHLVLYYPSWFVKRHIGHMSYEQRLWAYDVYGENGAVGFMLNTLLGAELGWSQGHGENCTKLLNRLAALLEAAAYPPWYCQFVRILGSSEGLNCEGAIRHWLNNEAVGHEICPNSHSLNSEVAPPSMGADNPDLVELIRQLFGNLVLHNENEARLAILMAIIAHDGRLEYRHIKDVELEVPSPRMHLYDPFTIIDYNILCCTRMRKEFLSSSLDRFTLIPLPADCHSTIYRYLWDTYSLAKLYQLQRSSQAKAWLTIVFTQSRLALPLPYTVFNSNQPISLDVLPGSDKEKDGPGQPGLESPLNLISDLEWCMKKLYGPLTQLLSSKQKKSDKVRAVLKLNLPFSSLYQYLLDWIVLGKGVLDVSKHYRSFCLFVLSEETPQG